MKKLMLAFASLSALLAVPGPSLASPQVPAGDARSYCECYSDGSCACIQVVSDKGDGKTGW